MLSTGSVIIAKVKERLPYSCDSTYKSRHQRYTSDVFEMATAITNQSSVNCVCLYPNNLQDVPQWELDWLKGLPTAWDDVKFIAGYPTKYAVVARKASQENGSGAAINNGKWLNVPSGYMPEQEDPAKTFDWIVNELNEAKPYLTKDVEFGQINYYGACMILAKMYLNHNAWFPTQAEDKTFYEKACDEVNEIINSGKYELASTYLEPFSANNRSKETILGLVYDKTNAGMGTNYYCKWNISGSGAIFNVTFDGWNGSAGIPQFINSYDPDDTRKTDCWIWGPQKNKTTGEQIYINDKPLDYTIDVYAIEKPGAAGMQGARLKKYEIVEGDVGVSNDAVPFFRLTDAYFIKAECLLRLGGYKGESEQVAADIVTKIRQRAFKNNPEKATRTVEQLKGASVYDYGLRETQGEIKDGVLTNIVNTETHEGGADIQLGGLLDDLAWEFVYEHHRRQDLIRFKMDNGCNVFNGKSWFGKSANTNASDHHLDIFPILKDNLQANPKLHQNPGYDGAK